MLTYLLTAFSGPAAFFMYALLVVLAFAIAVVIERSVVLMRYRCDPNPLIDRIDAAAKGGTLGGLTLGETPMEQVVRAGIAWSDPDLAWEAMAAASVEAELKVRRRIAYLSTVASIATMVGLFGTVYGLILAFGALGDVAAAERAAQLSQGSSTAMATTAFGLLVAIPSLGAHSLAEATSRELLGNIERVATRLVLALKAARA